MRHPIALLLPFALFACAASTTTDNRSASDALEDPSAPDLQNAAHKALAITAPARARIGSAMTVTGRGFHRGNYVDLEIGVGRAAIRVAGCGTGAAVRVKSDGSFSATFTVPAMDAGDATVAATSFSDSACKSPSSINASTRTLFLPKLATDPTVWPNTSSSANSDPFVVANHDRLTEMRPQLLVIRYSNAQPDSARFVADIQTAALEVDEGSRYRAYANAAAPAFLHYEVVKTIDTRDSSSWPDGNSDAWPFSSNGARPFHAGIADLFSDAYAQKLGFFDPSINRNLTLGELYAQGIINEVWFYGEQATDGSDDLIFEALELKEMYDRSGKKRTDLSSDGRYACSPRGCFDPCAGNGCYPIDLAHTLANAYGVSMRVGFMNAHQAGGSFLHSLGHSFEGAAGHDYTDPAYVPLPYLTDNFRHFANFDYQTRFPAVPFNSLYGSHCGSQVQPDGTSKDLCTVAFTHADGTPSDDALTWTNTSTPATVTMDPYGQGCGNVHFPPNATSDYQYGNTNVVLAACETFGDDANGHDPLRPYASDRLHYLDAFLGALPAPTDSTADSDAAYQVFWRQSMPGKGNHAYAKDGSPMKNWWPFLFY